MSFFSQRNFLHKKLVFVTFYLLIDNIVRLYRGTSFYSLRHHYKQQCPNQGNSKSFNRLFILTYSAI